VPSEQFLGTEIIASDESMRGAGMGQRMMARMASHFAKHWSYVLLGSGSR